MKGWIYISLMIAGVVIGYLLQGKVEPEVITITKVDTVRISYADTVYKFITKEKRITVKDTILYRDTISIRDTVYVSYYSPFRVGSDTLNCSGIVNFDMSRFTFSNIKFQYPSRYITKTDIVYKPNWTYTAIGTAIGIIIGVVIR